LKIAVDSVLSQSFPDFELIIVDDGSTDYTKEIVDKYLKGAASKVEVIGEHGQGTQYVLRSTNLNRYTLNAIPPIPIHYYYQNNKGPAAARNKGIKEAKGEFICFLDSDDRFRKQKLKMTYDYIKEYPQYKIFHTEEVWYRNGKILSQKAYHKKPDGYAFESSLRICSISMSTAAIKKEIFNEIGIFDETMPACEDYDFWLRVTSLYPAKLIPSPLTIKEGGHPNQQSKKFAALDRFRIYAIDKILTLERLSDEQKKCAIKELNRKCNIYIKGAKKRGKEKEVEYYSNLARKWENNVGRAETTIRS